MSFDGAVDAWERINNFLGVLSGPLDDLVRPVVTPLVDALASVTGDQAAVSATAEGWRRLASAIDELGQDQERMAARIAPGWQGLAHESFQLEAATLAQAVREFADEVGVTADHLEQAAQEVALARDLVEDVIRELIEWVLISLVVTAALAVVSAGTSAVAGATLLAAEALIASTRIAKLLLVATKALIRFTELLRVARAYRTIVWGPRGASEAARRAHQSLQAATVLTHAATGADGAMSDLFFDGLHYVATEADEASEGRSHRDSAEAPTSDERWLERLGGR